MKKVKLFLDSGAYTAWVRKVEISLQEYIDFIHENLQWIEVYANLDSIDDPVRTWANQKEMERQGLHPLPVYHAGEDKQYLKKALEYEYFGIGGAVLLSTRTRLRVYNELFSLICPKSNSYLPTHKVHGFGMTTFSLIARYPWFSIDSTTWLNLGMYGRVLVPRKNKQGNYFYEHPIPVVVSNRSPTKKLKGGHFLTFTAMEQKQILEYFEMLGFKLGKSEFKKVGQYYKLQEGEIWGERISDDVREVEIVIEPGLSNDYRQRHTMAAKYFKSFEEQIPEWPWPYECREVRGFFGLG